MLRRAVIALAHIVALAACSTRPPTFPPEPPPQPSPAASVRTIPDPSLTPAPTAPPTPVPTPPAGLELVHTVERDGVRLTVELDRNPAPAAEMTWLTATVTNTGNDELTWFHDGCAIPVWVGGAMEGARWRLPEDQPGLPVDRDPRRDRKPQSFMEEALSRIDAGNGVVYIQFLDERFAGRKGTFGCADIGIADPVPAGASIVRRSVWDGFDGTLLGPPPTGLVRLTATFSYFWRASDPPESGPGQSLELPINLWVESAGAPAVHPAEAIQLALGDPRLTEVVAAREPRNGNEPVVRYDPLTGLWQVGLLDYTEPPRIHMVLVDANTGELVGWVERIWDYETDGFP